MPVEVLRATVLSLYFYSGMQLVTLLIVHCFLKRKFQLPGLEMLAFLLERHWKFAQMKIIFWVIYNAQSALEHFGNALLAIGTVHAA